MMELLSSRAMIVLLSSGSRVITLPGFGFDNLTVCDEKQWNIDKLHFIQ